MQQVKRVQIYQPISDTKIPIRIAFVKPDGAPNIISLWYKQVGDKIYCAATKMAKIVSYL